MAKSKKWIITISGEHPVDEVKKHLVEKGFSVEQVLDQIGSITGSATEDVAEQVKKIPGVADVSPDTSVDIGPPGAKTTW